MRRSSFRPGWLIVPAALIALAGLAIWLTRPPKTWVTVNDVPAALQVQVSQALAAAGYPSLAAPAWAGEAATWRAPASYQLFLAAPSANGDVELYTAQVRVDAGGQLSGPPRVAALTSTSGGDETAPLIAGPWLAYATQVGGQFQSLTCAPLSDPGRRLVFALDRPAEQLDLHWQAAAGSGPALAVLLGGGSPAITIDPAGPHLEPAGAGLTYTPVARGEQAWLPNLVSRVRELPFVGPEKIAFAENVYFTAADRITRWLHRAPPPAAEKAVALAPATGQPELTALPAPTVGAKATPTTALTASASPSAQPAPTSTAALPPVVAGSPTASATALPAPSPLSTASAMPTAAPTQAPKPPPTPVPTSAAPPAAGFGRLADGVFRRERVQPDPQRPYAAVDLIELDPDVLELRMVPGTIEPRPSTGLVGSGVIPQDYWPRLVAGFNGGFAAMHGAFGMMVDRKVYLPARNGVATIAVYEDGSLRMGTWGTDLVQTPDMVSYRQNCPPLIENGHITAETGKLTLWGLSVSNEVYLYRSGLGVTADGRLVYAAGKSLSAYTLARALQMAGAQYAMQLDVDEYHVAFITYDVQPGQAPRGQKLRDDMRGFDGLFLRPFQLDFFYLLRRPQRLAGALHTGTQAAPAAAPAPIPDGLPGRLAFASNRDGNWEVYSAPPSRPAEARRLTDHPADDLYPAWSLDGARLAFASRRDGNSEIYTMGADGGVSQRVTNQPSEEWAPVWAPDGTRLAYQTDRNGQSDIYTISSAGGAETRLTPEQGNHEAPHWSPDGRLIAFDSDLDVAEAVHASINLYVMQADGSNPRRLMQHAESPSWSPDGKMLAFTGMRAGHWQLLLMGLDGSGYRQLTNGPYDARYPSWSPDGRWLAFAGNQAGHWELYVVPAAGGAPVRLTYGAADSSYPAWGK